MNSQSESTPRDQDLMDRLSPHLDDRGYFIRPGCTDAAEGRTLPSPGQLRIDANLNGWPKSLYTVIAVTTDDVTLDRTVHLMYAAAQRNGRRTQGFFSRDVRAIWNSTREVG